MGVDTHISLAPNVRIQDVANVAGVLRGLPVTMGKWIDVSGANVRGYENMPQMARIDLRKPNGDVLASYNFHFENAGGRKVMTCRATAENIALARRLVDFFGGAVDYQDCDDEDTDYTSPDRDDHENCPDDGAPWRALQQRIAELKPITKEEVRKWAAHAAYLTSAVEQHRNEGDVKR